ncbi:alpha/beta hydrolase fold domain-containing protein [Roseomonas fluvialis]|uniref:Alpha/beta hydrolase fold-3 domain-containing protein n=1 Tax=Roseomonas fluvialis TaxID=1750527 RepID=A0ABM7Y4I2_9PROT|nr:alpha/beta hydrolase [Roseomonas fluvialis]BDG72770.1 hypothetical protein Rmf_26990 [Roseomonas fluvialis]
MQPPLPGPAMILHRRVVLSAALAAPPLAAPTLAQAPAPTEAPRTLPARLLPVPRSVSAELQHRIAAPYPANWDHIPPDTAGWRALQAASAAEVDPLLPGLIEALRITVTPTTIAGVPAFDIAPRDMRPDRQGRLLVHLHGGGYVLYPGRAGAGEAMLMAGFAGFRCLSVDYRMPPDHPFPAALDDAIAAWRAVTAQHDPRRLGLFGSSAGGGLLLATLLRARAEGLPPPAAIAPGTPWCDLAGEGDSVNANAYVDNVLVSRTGWLGAAAALYAAGRDLRDPLLSPVNGDLSGFPPAILTSGTRDLLLSDTVRAHRRLRRAGVVADLQVLEGQSHAQFLDPTVPEAREAFNEIGDFLARYLGT